MSLDLTTLRLLRKRRTYERLAKSIPSRALDTRTQILLADFGRFFREFPDVLEVDAEPFTLMFRMVHGTMSAEDLSVYTALFKKVCSEEVEPGIEAGLLTRLAASAAAYDLADAITKFNDGAEIDLRTVVQGIVEGYDDTVKRKIKNPQVLTPIEDIMAREENDFGFQYRLPCLRNHIKPTRPGDFIVWAARPDKGKTSLIAYEAVHAAAQIDTLFPGENRSVLWLNNEGPGDNIVFRTFQAALQVTPEEMVKLNREPPKEKPEYRTLLREQYVAAIGGRGGALRIFDIHGLSSGEVEGIIRNNNPGLVIFDMVDNIKWAGDTTNGGQRTDQLLEAMYQWARLLAVKYGTAVWATSQVSGEGDGLQYPSLGMLKDSKTGKQGAADVIITMGAVNDPTLEASRYMGCTKNKRGRTGMRKSPMQEVIFDKDRCKFYEME